VAAETTSKVASLGELSCVKSLLVLSIHYVLLQSHSNVPGESVCPGDGDDLHPSGYQRQSAAFGKGPPRVEAITTSFSPQDIRLIVFWSREGPGLRARPKH